MSGHHAWLHANLSALVADGVITEDQAARLRERFPAPPVRSSRVAVVPAIGLVLVGLGALELGAERWDGLSKAARTVLSLVPAAATLAYDAWLRRPAERRSARGEVGGTALLIAFGVTGELLRSTWGVSLGDARTIAGVALASLVFAWVRSLTGPLVAFPALVLAFAASLGSERSGAATFLASAMLAAAIPAIRARERGPTASRWLALSFGLASLVIAVKSALEVGASELLSQAAWALGAHAVACAFLDPFGAAAGTMRLLVRLTAVPLLLELGFARSWVRVAHGGHAFGFATVESAAFTAMVLAPWGLLGFAWIRRAPLDRAIVALGVLVFCGRAAMAAGLSATPLTFVAIALALGTGIERLREGQTSGARSELNFGLALTLGVVIVQLVNAGLHPVLLGMLLIAAGATVVVANRAVVRRSS